MLTYFNHYIPVQVVLFVVYLPYHTLYLMRGIVH